MNDPILNSDTWEVIVIGKETRKTPEALRTFFYNRVDNEIYMSPRVNDAEGFQAFNDELEEFRKQDKDPPVLLYEGEIYASIPWLCSILPQHAAEYASIDMKIRDKVLGRRFEQKDWNQLVRNVKFH